MRLVRNVEGAISKITIKMTEEDAWFEEKTQQVAYHDVPEACQLHLGSIKNPKQH